MTLSQMNLASLNLVNLGKLRFRVRTYSGISIITIFVIMWSRKLYYFLMSNWLEAKSIHAILSQLRFCLDVMGMFYQISFRSVRKQI